ncbi:MAG: thioredoxin domain-containing protein, partial [bacterium]|nr:thioredoxin domain-containing protein [bacterium]
MLVEHAPNLLIHEQSPYLLQHAYNPVAWEPWSDVAFARAAAEDKPVFVSIGYAACHWCHVMERESFENAEVAKFLNINFVSIKVDREERPDVDALCMDVCQTMTGHGGWPLTIFMDAERRPFMAGTYFPRETTQGRLGFLDLLRRIHDVWTTDRDRATTASTEIMKSLQESATIDFSDEIDASVFDVALDHHERMFDTVNGGFSTRPKFPSPHHLLLLMRIANDRRIKHLQGETVQGEPVQGETVQGESSHDDILTMVTKTLDAMRAGGIYDHVGFGFHRYSTDSEWLVPHFEKMLYDQAMMMLAYAEAYQITRDETYKQVVLEIAEFLRRDMTSSDGAFVSAHDADSEGEEGKFYVWSFEELEPLADLRALSSSVEQQNLSSSVEQQNQSSSVEQQNLSSSVEQQNLSSSVEQQNLSSSVE